MRISQITGKGSLKTNQDFICTKRLESGAHFCMIADGIGGYERGDEAAEIAAESIFLNLRDSKNLNKQIIKEAVQKANFTIKEFNTDNSIASGATIGGVIIENDDLHVFWVGDVMVYCIENGKVAFQTKSHSLKNSLFGMDALEGGKTLDKYSHIVTRSLSGKSLEFNIGYSLRRFLKDEICIVCSDGVYETISVSDLLSIRLDAKSLDFIEKQLKGKAQDNFSLIHIEKS